MAVGDQSHIKNRFLDRTVLWMLFILLSIVWLTRSFWQPYYFSYRCEHLATQIEDDYELFIRYNDPSEFFVPPLPPLVEVPEKGFYIGRSEPRYVITALKGIKYALSKYPPELIKKHLKAVFIPGVIETYDVQIGGSYFSSWIYLSALEKYEQAGSELYSLNFHHELSSLFFNGGGFPTDRWIAVNSPGFSYLPTQIDVVQAADQKNRKDPKDAPSWYKAGFVHDYGMTSIENDINMYAELAMTNPERLQTLAQEFPKINAKAQILVEFYSGLAPELGEYFKSVGLNDALVGSKTANNKR